MRFSLCLALFVSSNAFVVSPPATRFSPQAWMSSEEEAAAPPSEEEVKEAVGNLVADDEWMGLSMEITEMVRTAIIQDVKTKGRDFLGKVSCFEFCWFGL